MKRKSSTEPRQPLEINDAEQSNSQPSDYEETNWDKSTLKRARKSIAKEKKKSQHVYSDKNKGHLKEFLDFCNHTNLTPEDFQAKCSAFLSDNSTIDLAKVMKSVVSVFTEQKLYNFTLALLSSNTTQTFQNIFHGTEDMSDTQQIQVLTACMECSDKKAALELLNSFLRSSISNQHSLSGHLSNVDFNIVKNLVKFCVDNVVDLSLCSAWLIAGIDAHFSNWIVDPNSLELLEKAINRLESYTHNIKTAKSLLPKLEDIEFKMRTKLKKELKEDQDFLIVNVKW